MPEEIRLALIAAAVAIIGSFGALVVRKLNSIDRAVNHKPPGAASLAEDTRSALQTTEVVLGELHALKKDTLARHEENSERIDGVEQRLAFLLPWVRDLAGVIRTLGRSMGLNLPAPPLERTPPLDPPSNGGS